MLRPSYSELMDILNNDRDLDNQITSRYTIVIAAAKRARQIVSGAPFVANPEHKTDKAVSQAVDELSQGLVKLYSDGLPSNIIDAKRELEFQKSARFTEKAVVEEEVSGEQEEPNDHDAFGFLSESYIFAPDDFEEEPSTEAEE